MGFIAILGLARPASAAVDFYVVTPTVFAAPGEVVQIPIDVDRSIAGFDIQAIQYTLPIDPAIVSNVSLLSSGLVWTWGTPFTNVTSTSVALATAGVVPISSSSTLLHTLQLTVSPTAVLNSAMSLQFSELRFNETTPEVGQHAGFLVVRTGIADVRPGGPSGIALYAPSPNPASRGTRITYELPGGVVGERVALEIIGLDGRRISVLRDEAAVPGRRETAWDLRDAAGGRVPPGIYFARLTCGATRLTRRIVALD
jgi:hypothetical protein